VHQIHRLPAPTPSSGASSGRLARQPNYNNVNYSQAIAPFCSGSRRCLERAGHAVERGSYHSPCDRITQSLVTQYSVVASASIDVTRCCSRAISTGKTVVASSLGLADGSSEWLKIWPFPRLRRTSRRST